MGWWANQQTRWSALRDDLSRPGWLAFLLILLGGSLLTVLLIPWGASGPRGSSELFGTLAQTDAGLLIALAVEGHSDKDRFRADLTSMGSTGAAISLLCAITGLILVTNGDPSEAPATWRLQWASSFFAVFAVGGLLWAASMLLARLVPRQDGASRRSRP